MTYTDDLASLDTSKEEFYLSRVASWIGDTEYASSTRVMTNHPKFAELVGMGESALTFTLAKIRDGEVRVHWFPLLKRLANDDPVPPQDRGYSDKMAAHWLQWGRGRGKV